MLTLEEIEETITQLEKGAKNLTDCIHLSALYTCRKEYKKKLQREDEETKQEDEVVEEYNDILPEYKRYCTIKRKYQMNECSEEIVANSLQTLFNEIEEFLASIYNNSDFPLEREEFKKFINSFQKVKI